MQPATMTEGRQQSQVRAAMLAGRRQRANRFALPKKMRGRGVARPQDYVDAACGRAHDALDLRARALTGHSIVTLSGMPPLGISVTRPIGVGTYPAGASKRACWRIRARIAVASTRAKAIPMQMRGPAPNGMY